MVKRFTTFLLLFIFLVLLIGCNGKWEAELPAGEKLFQGETLLVYSGAGISKAMDETAQVFEDLYGVSVQLNYAGSAQLLGQMEINRTGDIFIGGSMNDADIAIGKGFADQCSELVYHIPAIAVPKGNPGGISNLEDLAKPGVKLILGDKESNAIGKKGEKIFEKNNLSEGVAANVVARMATVNEIITQISLGQGDAGLVWEDNGMYAKDMEIIPIPEEQNITDKVPACILNFSENEELARVFMDFITSEEGKAIFTKYGFQTI